MIELAGIGPGPMCTMLLADQGADVIRLDRIEPSGLGVAMDPRFDVNSRSRRSVALDLKSKAGIDVAAPGLKDNCSLFVLNSHGSQPLFPAGMITV